MKTVYNALFVLLLLTVFSGCKEEYIGQYPVDSVAPKQVSNVQVQNMKGRVVLTYTLPEEDDLLCVTACVAKWSEARDVQFGLFEQNRIKRFRKGTQVSG